jgi:cytochrome bd-type quinol oxidase subunit 2
VVLQAVVFLGLVLVVVTLVHYYLWRRLIRDTTVAGRARRVGTWTLVGLIVVLLGALVGSQAGLPLPVAEVFAWPGYLWLAVMFYLLVGLVILEIPAGRSRSRPGWRRSGSSVPASARRWPCRS